MQLQIHQLQLPLKRPFTIAHGTFYHRDAVIVELKDQNLSGFGEATAISCYGKTVTHFIETLEKHRTLLEKIAFEHPSELYQQLYPHFSKHPFLLCALDIAAHDLWAKRLGKPLYQAWNLDIDKLIDSNFTIGIDSMEEMAAQVKKLDFPIYKIKLGTKEDIAIITELRKHTKALFRVDANGAWTVEETLQNAKALKKLEVEFIEQPLMADNWEGMKVVYENSVLPIIADESCQVATDVTRCADCFHGINIKLMKCGGFTPALQMIKQAKNLGLKVMVGCMTESSIGISAIAHLLPLLDYVDMDGALLLKDDPAVGVRVEKGKVIFGKGIGLGAVLKNEE